MLRNPDHVRNMYKFIKLNDIKKLKRCLRSNISSLAFAKTNYEMEALSKDSAIYKIRKEDENGFWPTQCILKKIEISEEGSSEGFMGEFGCELFINTLMTIDYPKTIVPLINACMDDKHMYLFFEYIREGTVHDYLNNAALTKRQLIRLFIACMKAIKELHSSKYGITHFDLRPDNMFIEIVSNWVDDDFDGEPDTIIETTKELDNDDDYNVRIGDFGLSELSLSNKRMNNKNLPRPAKYKKKWGIYPTNQTNSYDILYFLVTVQDNLHDIHKSNYISYVWEFIEKKYKTFNRTTFFNREGRMHTSIGLNHADIDFICEDVKQYIVTEESDLCQE